MRRLRLLARRPAPQHSLLPGWPLPPWGSLPPPPDHGAEASDPDHGATNTEIVTAGNDDFIDRRSDAMGDDAPDGHAQVRHLDEKPTTPVFTTALRALDTVVRTPPTTRRRGAAVQLRPAGRGLPMPQFFDLDPTVRPVQLSARPADSHPYDFDPASVRIVRANRVQHRDVVLGEVYGHDPAHTAGVSYLAYGCIPYAARPRPIDPACPCELCSQHRADPFTDLTDPIALTVWPRDDLDPVRQLNNADELLVVIPVRRLPA
ncbi:hypothetical protein ACO0M4_10245 [Streptomyces sp. RGM 3693]|uniref:hypothetical protein n=1 Tax=Streptomyces sp. RGM 3693 TaxID=3413284 RepID=UPI003D2D4D8D